ncbi:polymer-forming cytoskeletal protein [Metallumcola ferriviriculae]|uniref:Polymer-forming cytoskeletal protein n=1 Tax=Metallumcola ferriviriculae TaxID=3039180 RepID=A0AAU0UL46_9FIRM|nr:polymer-forming cytoskeletal protein [Desulfitibacteraceae bacterium MK1]
MLGKKKKKIKQAKLDTIIGKGTCCQGKVAVEGTLRVDGKVEGEVMVEGSLVVGKTGFVEGAISGNNAIIAGEVKGNIQMKEKLELHETAKVYGDVMVGSFIIYEGAEFKGQSQMVEDNTVDFKPQNVEDVKVG